MCAAIYLAHSSLACSLASRSSLSITKRKERDCVQSSSQSTAMPHLLFALDLVISPCGKQLIQDVSRWHVLDKFSSARKPLIHNLFIVSGNGILGKPKILGSKTQQSLFVDMLVNYVVIGLNGWSPIQSIIV